MTAAAQLIKDGLVAEASGLAGIAGIPGPAFGQIPPGEVIVVTLKGSAPDDGGDAAEVHHVQAEYDAGRGQVYITDFELEIWGNSPRGNFDTAVNLAKALHGKKALNGIRVGWFPIAFDGEENTGSDNAAYLLTAEIRCAHLASNAGEAVS